MSPRHPLVAAVLLVLATASLALSPPAGAATDAPTVGVSRASGLARGDVLRVRGQGFAPRQELRVVQCDTLSPDPSYGCPVVRTVTTDARGRVLTRVRLQDLLIDRQEFGDGRPVYCRADACRIFLASTDELGEQQGVGSRALRFTGSPATIAVTPSTDLRRDRWVRVTGTAYGAEGHRVRIGEHVCFSLVQATDCYGDLPFNWAQVRRDGTFATSLRVHRFVPTSTAPDGQVDCNGGDELLGSCQVTVTVLDAVGRVDDSFGLSRTFGDPAAPLTFAP